MVFVFFFNLRFNSIMVRKQSVLLESFETHRIFSFLWFGIESIHSNSPKGAWEKFMSCSYWISVCCKHVRFICNVVQITWSFYWNMSIFLSITKRNIFKSSSMTKFYVFFPYSCQIFHHAFWISLIPAYTFWIYNLRLINT